MANIKSAEKRNRQAIVRRGRNRARKSRLRTQIKKLRTAAEQGDRETAQELLGPTISLLDKTAKKGTIHSNAAARRKSRLTRLVAKIGS